MMISICISICGFLFTKQTIFTLGLAFTVVFSSLFGIISNKETHTKKIVKPEIKITCINGKCDTIYIYKF